MSRTIIGKEKHTDVRHVAHITRGFGAYVCEFHDGHNSAYVNNYSEWPTEKAARDAARHAVRVLGCEIVSDTTD